MQNNLFLSLQKDKYKNFLSEYSILGTGMIYFCFNYLSLFHD